jgi:hypothetical protein
MFPHPSAPTQRHESKPSPCLSLESYSPTKSAANRQLGGQGILTERGALRLIPENSTLFERPDSTARTTENSQKISPMKCNATVQARSKDGPPTSLGCTSHLRHWVSCSTHSPPLRRRLVFVRLHAVEVTDCRIKSPRLADRSPYRSNRAEQKLLDWHSGSSLWSR